MSSELEAQQTARRRSSIVGFPTSPPPDPEEPPPGLYPTVTIGNQDGAGIEEALGLCDRALLEMGGARDALEWAEQHLAHQKEVLRDRLLKG